MNKKQIKLTESDLHKIINKSIKRVLKESQQTDLDIAAEKMINALDESYQSLVYHNLIHYPNDLSGIMLDILKKKGIEDYKDIDPDDCITNLGDYDFDI